MTTTVEILTEPNEVTIESPTVNDVSIQTSQNEVEIQQTVNAVEVVNRETEVLIVETIGPRIAQSGSGDTVILRLVAGEALTLGDVITVSAAGEALVANATISTTRNIVLGFVDADYLAGEEATIRVAGRAVSRFAVAPGAADNGREVFLSTLSGLATLTPPTISGTTVTRLGVLLTGDGVTTTPAIGINIETRADIP